MSIAVGIALQDIQKAQAAGDITIDQAGAIIAATAARLSAVHSAASVDPMDLAIAAAQTLSMAPAQQLALVRAAIKAAA